MAGRKAKTEAVSLQRGDSEAARRRHAPGRMLVKSISKSAKLPRLIARLDEELGPPHGAYGALVYTWIKAHLDIEGRMCGHPRVVFGEVIPRLEAVGDQHVKAYLRAMALEGLYDWYEVDGELYLSDPAFDAEQSGLRDRGAGSALPPPREGRPVVAPVFESQGGLFQRVGERQAPASRLSGASETPPPPQTGALKEREGEGEVEGNEKGKGVCVARAGAGTAPDPASLPRPPATFGEQLQVLWEEVCERSSNADSHSWMAVLRQLQGTARVRKVEPLELARKVFVAFRDMLADSAAAGQHHGAPTVELLAEERWFSASLNWMDGKRPVRRVESVRGGTRLQGRIEPTAAAVAGDQ